MARKPKRDLTVEEQLARGPMDLPFLMLVLLLLGIGLIMMFSASYATAYYDNNVGDPMFYIKRQAMFAAVGVVAMYVVSKINYQTFRWMSVPALIFSIILLLLVFTPLGRSHNGARRWLYLGIEFQPSEFAKIAVILFFAARLCKRDSRKPLHYKNRTFRGRMLEPLGTHWLSGAGALYCRTGDRTGPGAAGAAHVGYHPGHGGRGVGAFCGGD